MLQGERPLHGVSDAALVLIDECLFGCLLPVCEPDEPVDTTGGTVVSLSWTRGPLTGEKDVKGSHRERVGWASMAVADHRLKNCRLM
jgi:hypothetical protein